MRACPAWLMTRICSGGTVAKPKPPMSTSATIVSTCDDAVSAKPVMTTASIPRVTTRVRGTETCAARPPSALPASSPTPKSTRSHGTVVAAKPLTPVSVYAM